MQRSHVRRHMQTQRKYMQVMNVMSECMTQMCSALCSGHGLILHVFVWIKATEQNKAPVILWYSNLQPTVFHLQWLGWMSARSPMTENTLICVCVCVCVCVLSRPAPHLVKACLPAYLSLSLCSEGKQTRPTYTPTKTLGSMRAHPFQSCP